jgi:hypothetical protein
MMPLRREIDRGVGVGLGRALIALMSGFDGAPAMKPLNYQVFDSTTRSPLHFHFQSDSIAGIRCKRRIM